MSCHVSVPARQAVWAGNLIVEFLKISCRDGGLINKIAKSLIPSILFLNPAIKQTFSKFVVTSPYIETSLYWNHKPIDSNEPAKAMMLTC